MNYQKFCLYDMPIDSLTQAEIENPYLVFEDLASKRTCFAFQMELSRLQKIIYLEDEWMNFEPWFLYSTYKDLTRLIDACYLIYKYSPGLGSVGLNKSPEKLSNLLAKELDSIFIGLQQTGADADLSPKAAAPKTFLQRFYDSRHLGYLKIDLHNYLQIGLNASYMKNCKYEYFAIIDANLMFQFRDLSELILEAYTIHAMGRSVFPDLKGCSEKSYAIDKSHTSLLSYEHIEAPLEMVNEICEFCFKADRLYVGLRAWKKMLFEADVWIEGGSPGNLLYLHENLLKLIDAVWLLYKTGKLKELDEKFHRPGLMIINFFAYKSMHEWKALLTGWLECSLRNKNKYKETDKSKTKSQFKQLYKFIEAVYLLHAS